MDYFWTYTTQFDHEDNMYYVRLEKMESGTCKTLGQVDLARFHNREDVEPFLATLPEPEEMAAKEAEPFKDIFVCE